MVPIASNNEALIAQGVKFRVLARAFPVLRHDALKPIANAKLATAMMQRAAGETQNVSEERTQQLLSDVDFMLDEGVDSVRLLGDWLAETDKQIDSYALLKDCIKLLFSDLLHSGKKVSLLDAKGSSALPLHSSRYIIFGWLLHVIEQSPDGSAIDIGFIKGNNITATVRPGCGGTVLRATVGAAGTTLSREDVQCLASHYGWAVDSSQAVLSLKLPRPARTNSAISRAA